MAVATGTKLGLQRDDQRVLRVVLHRLAGLANESAENEDIPQWEGSEMNNLENLLQSASEAKTLHASAAAATRLTHAL